MVRGNDGFTTASSAAATSSENPTLTALMDGIVTSRMSSGVMRRPPMPKWGMDTRSEGTMPAVLSDAPAGWAYDLFELTESGNVRTRAGKQRISSQEIRDHGEEALKDSSTTCTCRSCFSWSSPLAARVSCAALTAKYRYELKIRQADVTKIESSHMIDPSWNSGFKRFFSQHSIFWFRSDFPLNTELSHDATADSECVARWAIAANTSALLQCVVSVIALTKEPKSSSADWILL
ncbi:hypothetical protein PF008_g16975 [Phytophthora fragariae]|uniref:Uncharacterized protein n=1 Tax=Phytophthora fragariae TaxID=53985 RepID=A0A6G0R9L7_9STRA|nr:hypothetical protein PF008_g16975 [Phytophthora fragariae]